MTIKLPKPPVGIISHQDLSGHSTSDLIYETSDLTKVATIYIMQGSYELAANRLQLALLGISELKVRAALAASIKQSGGK